MNTLDVARQIAAGKTEYKSYTDQCGHSRGTDCNGKRTLPMNNTHFRSWIIKRCETCMMSFAVQVFLTIALLFSDISANANELILASGVRQQVKAEEYTYSYDIVTSPSSEDKSEIIYKGKITINNRNGENIYEEITGLDPRLGMCGRFPMLSKLPLKVPGIKESTYEKKWLVVFCGSSAGHHQTLKIFIRDLAFDQIKSATLDYGDTIPNLALNNKGSSYIAKVYRRILFPKSNSGLQNCLLFYKLHLDHNLFSFIPAFEKEITNLYSDNYRKQKSVFEEKIGKQPFENTLAIFNQNAGSMLSSLLATQDKTYICSELKTFITYGIKVDGLQRWIMEIGKIGYPEFNIDTCGGLTNE